MEKRHRLRRRRDFSAVFRQSQVWSDSLIVLRALPNQLPHNRFGLVVSGRVGKAVVRNKLRRRFREVLRKLSLQPGWDVVVSARPPAAQADFQALHRSLVRLLSRANLLNLEDKDE